MSAYVDGVPDTLYMNTVTGSPINTRENMRVALEGWFNSSDTNFYCCIDAILDAMPEPSDEVVEAAFQSAPPNDLGGEVPPRDAWRHMIAAIKAGK